jgi:transposase
MDPNTNDLIAVDIAKVELQVRTDSELFKVTNNAEGFAKLLEHTKKLKHPLVVCEATGGYERALLACLHARNIPVALVMPSRIRAFARSEGVKAKSDPIDTKMILRFARQKRLTATPAPCPTRQQIGALMDRRSHLSEQLAREKNRAQNSHACIAKSIGRMIRVINKELEGIEAQIRKLIDADLDLKETSSTLQSVQGIGEVTAWSMIAYLSELGHLKRNQIVALAGLAPFNKDSGARKAKRSIEGGRAKIRKCLYMAAQSAARHNPVIKAYVEGLTARGKPYKCAMVAAMRKLLIHLHIQIKQQHFALVS